MNGMDEQQARINERMARGGDPCSPAAKDAEIARLTELCDRYRKALEIIAGQPQRVLEAMQAKAALDNIGAPISNGER